MRITRLLGCQDDEFASGSLKEYMRIAFIPWPDYWDQAMDLYESLPTDELKEDLQSWSFHHGLGTLDRSTMQSHLAMKAAGLL